MSGRSVIAAGGGGATGDPGIPDSRNEVIVIPEREADLGTLDQNGDPAWLAEFTGEGVCGTVHVVRALDPARALLALGADASLIRRCDPPAPRADTPNALSQATIGSTDRGVMLLGGRVGGWTFVFDDSGLSDTAPDRYTAAMVLSAEGGEAATGVYTGDGYVELAHAVDGEQLSDIRDGIPAEGAARVPAGSRAALEAVGAFDDSDSGETADGIGVRVACVLVALKYTVEGLCREG
jgi:hypothetical protein